MPLIKLLVEGGNMSAGPAVAQSLGPLGINMGKVISDVNSATSSFKGINVPVNLNVDTKTKTFTIQVLSPPTSELIKKELKLAKASGARLKQKVGNFSIEQVISVAKSKHDNLLSNEFLASVKSVIGTCMALGVLIESKDPKIVLKEIKEGKYDNEINNQKTETSPEKRKELDEFFKGVMKNQDALKKAEEAEAAEKEAKQAKAATKAAPAKADDKKKK